MYWDQSRQPIKSEISRRIGSTRTFGVELEVSLAYNYERLHGVTPFGARNDGSVQGDSMEFVSPILSGDAGLAAVENFLIYARSHEWESDDSCGFHVHIGLDDLTEQQLLMVAEAYQRTEKFWFTQVTNDRFSGDWCDSISRVRCPRGCRNFRDFLAELDCRYNWVNFLAYERYKTVEVRLHEGTLNRNEIISWIKAHLRFIDRVVALPDMAAVSALFNRTTARGQFVAVKTLLRHRGLTDYFVRRASSANKSRLLEQTVRA